jgi:hypothetical protein
MAKGGRDVFFHAPGEQAQDPFVVALLVFTDVIKSHVETSLSEISMSRATAKCAFTFLEHCRKERKPCEFPTQCLAPRNS